MTPEVKQTLKALVPRENNDYDDDILYFNHKLNHFFAYFCKLSEFRKMVLIALCFDVGVQGILNFKKMLSALERHDYEDAAKEMLDSKWSQQVGERATTLANIMRTNEL